MRLDSLVERLGEDWALALAGPLIGLEFGFLARHAPAHQRIVDAFDQAVPGQPAHDTTT
jgi:hypothetical protein